MESDRPRGSNAPCVGASDAIPSGGVSQIIARRGLEVSGATATCRIWLVLAACCWVTACFDGLIEDPGVSQGAPEPGVPTPPSLPGPAVSHPTTQPSTNPTTTPSGSGQPPPVMPNVPTPGTPTTTPTAPPPSDSTDPGLVDETFAPGDVFGDAGCDSPDDASTSCHTDGGSEAGVWRK